MQSKLSREAGDVEGPIQGELSIVAPNVFKNGHADVKVDTACGFLPFQIFLSFPFFLCFGGMIDQATDSCSCLRLPFVRLVRLLRLSMQAPALRA